MSSRPNPTGILNGVYDRVIANDAAVIPRNEHETYPVAQAGALLYDKSDQSLYVSDEGSWNLVGGPANDVHLNPVAGAAGTTLIADGVGPIMTLKSVVAGTGITLTTNGTDLSVANSYAGNATTLEKVAGASGLSLVANDLGPTLTIKGLVGGLSTAITTAGSNDIQIANNGLDGINNLRINNSGSNSAAASGTNAFALGHATSASNNYSGLISTSDDSVTIHSNTANSILLATADSGTYAPLAHMVAKGTGALDGYFMMAGTALTIPLYVWSGLRAGVVPHEFVNSMLVIPDTNPISHLVLPSWDQLAFFLGNGGFALNNFSPGLTGWRFRFGNTFGDPFTLNIGPQRGWVSGAITCYFQDYDGTQTQSFVVPNNKVYEFAVIMNTLTGIYVCQYVGCLNVR
jgi:hypothetical protein